MQMHFVVVVKGLAVSGKGSTCIFFATRFTAFYHFFQVFAIPRYFFATPPSIFSPLIYNPRAFFTPNRHKPFGSNPEFVKDGTSPPAPSHPPGPTRPHPAPAPGPTPPPAACPPGPRPAQPSPRSPPAPRLVSDVVYRPRVVESYRRRRNVAKSSAEQLNTRYIFSPHPPIYTCAPVYASISLPHRRVHPAQCHLAPARRAKGVKTGGRRGRRGGRNESGGRGVTG